MKFLRNVAILLSVGLLICYSAAALYLYVSQRELLFPRDQQAIDVPSSGSIYQAREVVESDGTRLSIWQSRATVRGKGTFVFFYGNASSQLEFAAVGQQIHRCGLSVVLASYRGYGGNSGSPSERGLMADARAILKIVPKEDGPIILWGHSLGSGVAARMASEGRASALVLESPFTAAVDVAASAYPLFPVRLLMKDRFDTMSLVPAMRIPVLILHGAGDQVVPTAMGQSLARALGTRATFVPISGAGHDIDATALWPLVRRWLFAHSQEIYGVKFAATPSKYGLSPRRGTSGSTGRTR